MSDKDIFNKLKSEFLTWYENQKEVAYYFTAKDAGSLKQLIKKDRMGRKDKARRRGQGMGNRGF